ncbi:MAG: hypothetical protein KC503_30480 [Myxococcales bacterium]|nr:hypothetical protein [Myxococcales bacterium]
MSAPITLAIGPRALEAQLVADIAADQRALREDLSRLSAPLRVIVSSGALRAHVAATLVREVGDSVLGVVVQTLWGAAREVLERAGLAPPVGGALFEVLARRAAAEQPQLARLLEPLDDGYGVVGETLRDFLSAGLTRAIAAELETITQREIRSDVLRDRTLALVRAAARCERSLRELGVGRSTDLLAVAAQRLRASGAQLLPARAVLVTGFSDATGQAVRLIDTLRATHGARVYVHQPPQDVLGGAGSAGQDQQRERLATGRAGFLARFLGRLGGETTPADARSTRARIALFDASGADGEVREVAYRVRELCDEGVAPERIGIT